MEKKNEKNEVVEKAVKEVVTKSMTEKEFNALLVKAGKAQTTANNLWHSAQKHAVEFMLSKDRNLAPMNRMIQAVFECKSLRVMALVKFIMHLAGGEEDGCLSWDAKEMKLSFKKHHKGAGFRENAKALSDTTPFWIHKPEAITPVGGFDDIFKAIKRIRKQADEKKVVLTAKEKALLEQFETMAVKHDPHAFESKRAKKA